MSRQILLSPLFLLGFVLPAGLLGCLRGRRVDAAYLQAWVDQSGARSVLHSREQFHPRRASRLDAFRFTGNQVAVVDLYVIAASWEGVWCATSRAT
jgi:hypothetical protein